MSACILRSAVADEAGLIAALINRAYRGETSRLGWTTEADLLDGQRTNEEDIFALLQRDDVLMLTCWQAAQLIATLCIKWMPSHRTVQLGMIAVEPVAQNRGHGKTLILAAEQQSVARWQALQSQMRVVSVRQTLIAFYQRLGYQPTGERSPFPVRADLWQPKVEHLQLMTLQKQLQSR